MRNSSKHFLGLSLNDLLCSELQGAGPLNSVVNPEAVRKSERATRGVSHKAERKADVQSHDSCK